MLSLPINSATHLIILTSAPLYQEATPALPAGQLDVEEKGMLGHVSQSAVSLQPGQPTLLLIDLPASSPPLAQPLESGASQPTLLVLADAGELDQVLPLGWAGATGRLSQDGRVIHLAAIASTTRRGEMVFLPPVLDSGESGNEALIEPLSERELEVLRLLAQSLTNQAIAQILCLSVLTVKTHLHRIFGKLGVRSRTEAALWAAQHGYGRTE